MDIGLYTDYVPVLKQIQSNNFPKSQIYQADIKINNFRYIDMRTIKTKIQIYLFLSH